jgi:hypothetical protein
MSVASLETKRTPRPLKAGTITTEGAPFLASFARSGIPRLHILWDFDSLTFAQWLKKHGKGYETRINAILRSYMEAQSNNAR